MATTTPPARTSPGARAVAPARSGRAPADRPAGARPGLAADAQGAWTRSPWNPLVTDASPRLLETVLSMGLVLESVAVPGLGIPLPELCAMVLLLVASFRRPRRDLGRYAPLALLAAALLLFLVAATLLNGLDPSRRGIRIAVLMLLVYALAGERLDVKGVLYGMAAAALVNVPLFFAGVAPAAYGSYLTGFLGDKNVAGLFYAFIPLMLVATLQRMGPKLVVLAVGAGLTFLTGSRTSLAALLCAGVWILVSPYLGRVLRLVLLYGMGVFVSWAEDNLAQLGIFGDRTGTDWFRAQIQAASAQKAAASPWYGQGLSTATVDLDQGTFFFHNSYLGLITEGGWIFLLVVVGAYVLLCLRPFAATRRSPSRVAVEAASVVLLVASLQLGEVFITLYGAVLLGAGLLLTAQEDEAARGTSAAEDARRRRAQRVLARSRRQGLPAAARPAR